MSVYHFILLLLFSLSALAMEVEAQIKTKSNVYMLFSKPPEKSQVIEPDVLHKLNIKDKQKRIKIAKKELRRAIINNDINKIKGVMSSDISAEIQKNSKKNYIGMALDKGFDSRTITLLLNNEPNLIHSCLSLCREIENLQFESVQTFLNSKISEKIVNSDFMVNNSPLAISIKINNKNMVELLLNYGADVNVPTFDIYQNSLRKRSHLGLALEKKPGNEGVIELLINAGAKINLKTEKHLLERFKAKQRKYHK